MAQIRRRDSDPKRVSDIEDWKRVATRSLSTSDLSLVEIDNTFSDFMERAIELTRNMKGQTESEYVPHLKTI
jgi:hypothetical protein